MQEVNDGTLLSLYQQPIDECIKAGCNSYGIYATSYDLNHDGNKEIISYFMSSLNSGSCGNITLDIWICEKGVYKNVGSKETLYLNPHHDENGYYLSQYASLKIMNKTSNHFYDLWYVIVREDNGQEEETVYQFTGNTYQQQKDEDRCSQPIRCIKTAQNHWKTG